MAEEFKKIISTNRKATFNFFIEERIEAGIVLTGPEVKSLRLKAGNIEDSHADVMKNDIYIFNMFIAEYDKVSKFSTQTTRRPRKLLLHKSQSRKLIGKIKMKGYTLIALSIYFNHKNLVKVEIGLAKGKKLHDKRGDLKDKDWNREQSRIMREKNRVDV